MGIIVERRKYLDADTNYGFVSLRKTLLLLRQCEKTSLAGFYLILFSSLGERVSIFSGNAQLKGKMKLG